MTFACTLTHRSWQPLARYFFWAWIAAGFLLVNHPALGQPRRSAAQEHLRILRDLLQQSEDSLDLAKAKLMIDKMVDPTLDVQAAAAKLDEMARRISGMLRPEARARETVDVLRLYLYKPGPWNGGKVYRYDIDTNAVRTKLLPIYLSERRGDCVSMPMLMIVLGQKLGLDMTAALTPEHVFVKFRDETGQELNLEATSGGGPARDAHYRQTLPMTQAALANGLYLRRLTKRETVAVMASTLMEHYSTIPRAAPEIRIALADLLLQHHPRYADAMIFKANAFHDIIERDFASKYARPIDIPLDKKARFLELDRLNKTWFTKAEKLGWRPLDAEALQKLEKGLAGERGFVA